MRQARYTEEELQEKYKNKKMRCNCQKSKCLKLYCECFAAGELCYGCNCCNCANIAENANFRSLIINQMKDRNPIAFKPKSEAEEERIKHIKGCNCTKSGCLKKYCECYQIGATCTDLCRCRDCKNIDLGKPKLNNFVKVINENTIIIKKKVFSESMFPTHHLINPVSQTIATTAASQIKFKNCQNFQLENISIQITNNNLQHEKKNPKEVAFEDFGQKLKREKKRAKKVGHIEHQDIKTPVKAGKVRFVKSTIMSGSNSKKNMFTPKKSNNTFLFTTTDKSRRRIGLRKDTGHPGMCENLSNRLNNQVDDIILNNAK